MPTIVDLRKQCGRLNEMIVDEGREAKEEIVEPYKSTVT